MRTTLTLDDDVAALLRRTARRKKTGLKTVINDALREGLKRLAAPSVAAPFRTRAVSLGRCRLGSLDDVAEVLAMVEGETFR